jgi:ABC-type uncharacterized transport system auxiliary subunit
MRSLLWAIAAVLLVAGCSAMRSAPPARSFRLAYHPPDPGSAAPLPVTVRVVPFGIAAVYNRESFVYRNGLYDVGVDPYNRWLNSPASMITDLLARDLAASRTVEAVLQAPSALPNDYELNGYVETLEERDDSGCSAHLRLREFLVRVPRHGARQVVQRGDYTGDEPCTLGDPESYAAAMSRAVEQVSEQIRAAILAAIATAP